MQERERGRAGERERERDSERETEKDRDRDRDREIYGERERIRIIHLILQARRDGPVLPCSSKTLNKYSWFRVCLRMTDSGLVDSGRGTTRAEDAQGTPTQSHIS